MNKILICGANWLGDGIMSMPAVRNFKQKNPGSEISMLVKPGMVPLWEMCPDIDRVLELSEGLAGTLRAAESINSLGFEKAFVLPNSFRSALIPFLAGVRNRRGTRGHQRSFLLNDIVVFSDAISGRHQLWEYVEIFGISMDNGELPRPVLEHRLDPPKVRKKHLGDFEVNRMIIGIVPGAAFGASKMWQADNFVSVGRRLAEEHNCHLLVFGTSEERDVCVYVSEEIGDAAVCLAGDTTLAELTVLMQDCSVVVCNDSGGMHLAAAAGSKVVAVYGVTDPAKTGPLGKGHMTITARGVEHSRDLDRASKPAMDALRSIEPEEVYQAVTELIR